MLSVIFFRMYVVLLYATKPFIVDEVVQQLIKDNEAAKNNDFECEPQMKS